MKKTLIILISAIITLSSVSAFSFTGNEYTDDRAYARAEITSIKTENVKNTSGLKLTKTFIHLRILDGEYKDQKKVALFGGENDLPMEMRYKTGNIVFVGICKSVARDSTEYISIYDIDNTKSIIFLVLLMVFAIILVGKWKGLASLAALIITILLLFFVLIPLTLKGYPPLPIAVAISIISILITLPIIAGFHLKTLAAVLGASGGIIFASLLAVMCGWIMHLSGIVTNDMLTIFYASDVNIDLRGLVLSGMIISALGAVMDVCISISSSTAEIYNANPGISDKKAFSSVLNIGTDILGSMVNTLILAYVGSSLSMILWIALRMQPGMPVWMIFNYNPVLNEIVKSVVGSIGMFLSIPATAFISVKLYSLKSRNRVEKNSIAN